MSGKRLVIQPVIIGCLILCPYVQALVPYEPVIALQVPGDYTTIQAAVDAAHDGDVVEIAPGRYAGPGNRDIDFKGKAISVRGSSETIIVCRDNNATSVQGHRGFYFHSNETEASILQNITIEQGLMPGDVDLSLLSPGNDSERVSIGGGIYCNNSSPTLSNIRILSCRAEMGGGFGCVGGNPTMINCEVAECVAGGQGTSQSGGKGGGLALLGGTHLQMTYSIVRNNMGDHDSRGAGIFIQNSSALIQHSEISQNKASGVLTGGGVYVASFASSPAGAEPAPYLHRMGVLLKHCLVTGNVANRGAAVFVESRSLIEDSTLVRDTVNSVPQFSMINVTVAANRLLDRDQTNVDDLPGAIVEIRGQSVEVRNSILWHNAGDSLWLEPASRAWISFSNIESRFPGPGNIHRDPLFVDVSSADFHLKSRVGRFDSQKNLWVTDLLHSPCIDRGHPDDAVAREPEPHGQRINMGAYGGTLQASKGLERRVWHVDSAAGAETNVGLSADKAFFHIQTAVDAAQDGDSVLIWPGTYIEQHGIVCKGKAITIQGALGAPLIKTPEDYAFSFYQREGHDSVLSNLIITGSRGAVYCESSSPTLQHLTIVSNDFGVLSVGGSDPVILNSIFWSNLDGDLYCDGQIQCRVDYSCIEHIEQSKGLGNISADPLFTDPVHEDFHLRSERGRYWTEEEPWIQDQFTSPCIDAGHPTLGPVNEPGPNGGRLNMGAYGGTDQASLSNRPAATDSNSVGLVHRTTVATVNGITRSSKDTP